MGPYASDMASLVTAHGTRPGSSNQHDRRTVSGRLERQVQIRANMDANAWKFFSEQALHLLFGFRLRRTGESCAYQADIPQAQPRTLHGHTARLANCRQRAAKTYAHWIGGTAAPLGAHYVDLVHQYAFGFSAAAIKAQNETHLQSIREAGDSV